MTSKLVTKDRSTPIIGTPRAAIEASACAGTERRFRIVTYASATDARPNPMELTQDELYALLEHEETDCVLADGKPGCRGKKCPRKDGLAWSPGYIPAGKGRLAANVESLDLAVFDVDHITQLQLEAMCVGLEGIELFLHSTHNHLPPDDQSFRLVFPLTRSITTKEWAQIWFSIVRKFNLPQDAKKGVDKATRDPCRLSYLPRALRGRPYINIRQEGKWLDPRELLLENLQHSRDAFAAAAAAKSTASESGAIDMGDLKGFLRRYKPTEDPAHDEDQQKGAIIKRVIAGEPLAGKGHRGLTALRAGTIIGKLLPLNTPVEAALELLRESISKVETFEDDSDKEDGVEAWTSKARRGYEGAQAEKAAEAADNDTASGMLAAVLERKKAERAKREWLGEPEPVGAPALAATPIQANDRPRTESSNQPASEGKDPDDWRVNNLITTVDKLGFPHPKNTAANITIVLMHHSAWKGALRYNLITNEAEAHGGPLPENERDPDRLITAIRNWLAHKEELDLPRYEVADHVDFVSRVHSYDPVRTHLLGLAHDGKARTGNWLITYCGARTIADDGADVGDYVRMVGEKWLMAGAARGLYPGCKADNVLVFEGEQYAGKSMMLDILGGEWFADTQLDLANKSTYELAAKSWIIELSELSAMKRAETESQKSFLSRRIDNFRLSYGRRVGKYPRRCIFAGTTNETQYLLDPTGNRRFWCVWCCELDIAGIRRDRDQLWAEAVAKVRAGETCPDCHGIDQRCSEHRWWLDRDQTARAEKVATTRLKADFAEVIASWWYGKDPAKRPSSLTTLEVLERALKLEPDKVVAHQIAIGRAMKALGFDKRRHRGCGGVSWIFVPSERLSNAPKDSGKP